jgi:hypothetical protein
MLGYQAHMYPVTKSSVSTKQKNYLGGFYDQEGTWPTVYINKKTDYLVLEYSKNNQKGN